MKKYKDWIEENRDTLEEDYAFDVHEHLRGENYFNILTLSVWCKARYEQLKEDEDYDKENGGGEK